MPPVIAAIEYAIDYIAVDVFAATDVAAIEAASAVIASTIVTVAEVAALSIGMAEIERALAPKQAVAAYNTLIKNSVVNRALAYGRTAVGGAVTYIGENGPNNQYLNVVFAMTDHQIDGVEQLVMDNWILNFDNTGLNGGGVCTGETNVRTGANSTRFQNLITCEFHLGVPGDSADGSLLLNSNGEWTSTCLLSGCSYVYLRLTWDQNAFSAGIPNIYCIIRGKKVLDPRTAVWPTGTVTSGSSSMTVTSSAGLAAGQSIRGPGLPALTTIAGIAGTTVTLSANATASWTGSTYIAGSPAWSQNTALCYFDYHTDQIYGFRSQPGDWDQGYLTTACNTCDATVHLANDPFGLIATTQYVYSAGVPGGTVISATGSHTATMSTSATASYSGMMMISNIPIFGTITSGSPTITFQSPAVEATYTCNGFIDTGDTPGSISDNMLGAMAGACPWVGGKWYLRAGSFQTPTVSLSDSDLRAPPSLSTKLSRRDTINSVKGTYNEPAAQYEPTDFTPYQNSTYIGQDLGIVYWSDVQFPFTTSNATAQRLAKIICQRSRAGQLVLTMPCKLTALACQCNDNVLVSIARFGFVNQVFEVVGFSFASYDDGNKAPTIGIDLVLKATNSNVWNWNAEESLYGNPTLSNLPSPYNPTAPTGLTLTSNVTTLLTQPDGTLLPSIFAQWSASTDQYVLDGGYVNIQMKVAGYTNWTDFGFVPGAQTFFSLFQVNTGITYDVRIRYLNSANYFSPWTEVDNCVASTGGAAAGVPTVSAAAGQGKIVAVTITPANVNDSTVRFFQIYRSSTSSTTGFTLIGTEEGTVYHDTSVTLGTQYWYTAASVNTSNVVSAQSAASSGVTPTQSSLLNTTAPSTPSALTTSGGGATYTASEGTTFADQTFNLPGLPSGAAWMQVLWRINGSSNWISTGEQITSGSTTTIYGLPTNTSIDTALIAYNNDGVASSVSTVLTFTTAAKSAGPAGPGAITLSSPGTLGQVPAVFSNTNQQFFGALLAWSADTTPDVAGYEVGESGSPGSSPATVLYTTSTLSLPVYTLSAGSPGFWWVRSYNRSGVRGPWVLCSTNMNSVCSYSAGSMSTQNQSGAAATALEIGALGSSSISAVNAVYNGATVLSGISTSAPYYQYTGFSIAGRGFTSAPTSAVFTTNVANVRVTYNPFYSGQTSSSLTLDIYTESGANIPASSLIVNFKISE